ncbi:hypothetical protein GUJ93_ZPchr0012g20491 [Zizania palustris]|uniref:Uncharacterized protein n=1 Tax=Zizania palustris TaxID=103762 RepID=A0A8J5WLK6_ZIZPA|nr:hypothetical protein GUJ93_ZPchr0012g20491 [Zizania palustris]
MATAGFASSGFSHGPQSSVFYSSKLTCVATVGCLLLGPRKQLQSLVLTRSWLLLGSPYRSRFPKWRVATEQQQ